jgi:succinate dehydrogenase/fumarate reductase-like Fe-S protein
MHTIGVRNIILEHLPELKGQKELDVDLDKMNTKLLRKLERYVQAQSTWNAKFTRAMSLRKQRTSSGHRINEQPEGIHA